MKKIAILLPWFSFFLREKYISGYVCLALQITIIGWPIASVWAITTLMASKTNPKDSFVLRSLRPLSTFDQLALEEPGFTKIEKSSITRQNIA